ncbi:MAG: ParB/RepB/Spo0J family partition protein [Bdellovibrionota bacterium]
MADNKKQKRGLGRGLSALISEPLASTFTTQASKSQTSGSSNAALDVNKIFSENFEKEKAKEALQKNTPKKVVGKAIENKKTNIINETLIDNKNINFIPLDKIITSDEQPREEFSEKSLNELSQSILKHGVLQPILVRKKGDKYKIIAGERRFRASKLAGLKEIPVIFKDLKDNDAYEIAVIENIQRENLNPIEEAKAYQTLMVNEKLSQVELAEKIGKDRSSVSNMIRILELPEEVQEFIKNREISLGHAKVLLSLKKVEAQKSFAKKIASEGLSVRELEKLVSDVWVLDAGRAYKDVLNNDKKRDLVSNNSKFLDIIDLLRQKLGTRVNIKHQKNGKGKVEIEYYSEDELERVVQVILKDAVNI